MHMGFDLDPVVLAHTGKMFLFDFTNPEQNLTELKFRGNIFDSKTFSPHGLSVYEDKKSGMVGAGGRRWGQGGSYTILCLVRRTTVTSLSVPKDRRCKTHPLCVNPGVSF